MTLAEQLVSQNMELYFSKEDLYKSDRYLKKEDVSALQEWVKKQPHLPHISEAQLMSFLYCCYYKKENTKTAIENFFTVRTNVKELFWNRRIDDAVSAAKVTFIGFLPKLTQEGYRLVFTKYLDTNPERYSYEKTIMYFDMLCTNHLATHGPQKGIVLVMDATGTSLGHILRMNLFIARKHLFYVQEAVPLRLKGVHIINSNSMAEKVLSLVKAFLNPELCNMLHFHSTMDSFYKFVPQKLLPKELGGENSSFIDVQKMSINSILNNAKYFKEEETQMVDEAKRLEKSNFFDDMGDVGVDGSFKKLDID